MRDFYALLLLLVCAFSLAIGMWAGRLLAYGDAYYMCASEHKAVFNDRAMLHPLTITCEAVRERSP